jgi:hypothetical protein
LTWLKNMVHQVVSAQQQEQEQEQHHLVAHRGFHNPLDRSDRRPLEYSLQAYEAAWTSGIHLCECDIALTKDEKLVLAHDADFSRLALDKDSPMYNWQVRDLTFRELIALPLKSGIRPPLLIDVLRSARAIEGHSQLIIEIKPGNNEAANALARLFIRHPDLMEQCAVIMSFDAFAMHTLRNDLAVLQLQHQHPPDYSTGGNTLRSGHRSAMSLGNIAMLVDTLGENKDEGGFMPLGEKRDSFDHFGVGLSMSNRDLEREQHGGLMNNANNSNNSSNNNSGSGNHFLPPLAPAPSTPSSIGMILSTSNGSFRKSPSNRDMTTATSKQESKRRLPKLMLLTVSDEPKIPCELQVSIAEPVPKIEQWLHRADGALDGVYMQYEPQMLSTDGLANLRLLASRYVVGVWNKAHKDPDDFETFHTLVKEGSVSFVNSDLPKGFMKPKNNGGGGGRGIGTFDA